MKTTLNLPDPLHRRAKVCAVERGTNLKELVVQALERELSPAGLTSARAEASHGEDVFVIDEMGWPVLRRKAGDAVRITNELVEELREREGV